MSDSPYIRSLEAAYRTPAASVSPRAGGGFRYPASGDGNWNRARPYNLNPPTPKAPTPVAPPVASPTPFKFPSGLGGGLSALGALGALASAPSIFGNAAIGVGFFADLGGGALGALFLGGSWQRAMEFALKNKREREGQWEPPNETRESKGVPPFSGGQSIGVGYTVIVSYGLTNAETNQVAYRTEALRYVTGRVTEATAYQSGATIRVRIAANGYVDDFLHSSSSVAIKPTAIVVQITRNDGLPDTGGNPPNAGATPFGRAPAPVLPPPYYNPDINPSPANPSSPEPSPNKPDKPDEQERKWGLPPPVPSSPNSPSPSSPSSPDSSPAPSGTPKGNPSGAPSPSPSGSPSPSQGLQIPSLAPPQPEGFKPPSLDPAPNIDPTKQPSPPPPSPSTPTPDLKPDLEQIKEQQKRDFNTLSGLILGIPLLLSGATVFRDAVKNSAKEATCEAAAPDGCLGSKLDSDKEEIKDAVSNGNEGVRAALAGILTFLQNMFEWIQKAFNNTIVDKAISYLTLITTIHNAAMLSTSIKDTLGDAISLGLATINIKGPEDQPIDVNEAINKSTENLIKGIVGADNYTALKETWAKASRIWQSGAAIIYNVRSLWDSSRSLDELTGNNIGRIGNALRRDGVVSENAYKTMSENVTVVNTAMNKLQSLDDSVSTLAAITSETYGITENVLELTKQKEDFDKAVKDFTPKTQIENEPLKAKEDTQKAVSQAPEIPLTELYKPDI